MITIDFSGTALRLKQEAGKTWIYDPIRKKWLVLTPEEHIRQHILYHLINVLKYPASLIAVEKKIVTANMSKRFDIVVYNREHKPWMLVECKSPDVEISERTLHQLLQYQNTLQGSYWMLTNGHQTFCADANDITQIKWLDSLPFYNF